MSFTYFCEQKQVNKQLPACSHDSEIMQKGANQSYFGNIVEGIASSWQGLRLSLKHLWQARRRRKPMGIADDRYFEQQTGMVTLTYPYESFPVPDNGRYRLHNEMEDCIVCDKCAEVCPVNCIEIEAVKSPEEIRKTSDGHSVRLYAATFDIDMAKCCFCGLCTTVCPTECLTMTKTYDFSEFDVRDMNYHFSDLSPTEAAEKRQAYENFQVAKQQAKAQPVADPVQTVPENSTAETDKTPGSPAKPVMKKPAMKPVPKTTPTPENQATDPTDTAPAQNEAPSEPPVEEPRPVAKKPVMKPVIRKKPEE